MSKIWKTFLDFLTLSNRKYRLIVFVIVLLLLIITPTPNLEKGPNLSINALVFKSFEGKCVNFLEHDYCDYPSKGILRGTSSILHLEFKQAYNYNPISFLVVLSMFSIMIWDIVMLIKKRK